VLPGVAPSNAYPCSDGREVLIAGNADSVFARLCKAIERPELADDPRFSTHGARGSNMAELDEVLSRWTRQLSAGDVIAILEDHGVPVGSIYTAADMVTDAHFLARDMVLRRSVPEGWEVPMNGIVPKFTRTPGEVVHTGPRLGEHTAEVLGRLAGVSEDELRSLADDGVI
jgi:crotonobetainyl-CoA:carnitine CoA-transferase CaiB-like acyl-CoA transferase